MYPRRYSQIERALQILDKSGTVDILKEDHHLLFLFKKTERIVSAVYIITGLFPDVEPLKWELRQSGTLLIRQMLSFKERATVHSKEFLSDTFAEMAHFFSLIDLAYIADLVSPMNFSILKKELESVRSIIEGKWRVSKAPFPPPFFDEHFFGIPKELFSEKETRAEPLLGLSQLPEGKVDDALHSISEFERLKRDVSVKDMYKGHTDIKDTVRKKETETRNRTDSSVPSKKAFTHSSGDQVKEERKQHIFSVLKERNTAMIKDFSTVIQGCSEKTIQRLLLELVQNGILKREGDRRWSRYSIAAAVGAPESST